MAVFLCYIAVFAPKNNKKCKKCKKMQKKYKKICTYQKKVVPLHRQMKKTPKSNPKRNPKI